MAIRHFFALGMIIISMFMLFKQYFALALALFLIGVILWFLIRLGADVFWWGKDNEKW